MTTKFGEIYRTLLITVRPTRPIKLALRARPAFGLLVRLLALDPEGTL